MQTLDTTSILATPLSKEWRRIGIYPHHGIVIPLFCLNTAHSTGLGEYSDLLKLIPWCKLCGFDTLQLLPLNDTGLDPSPYSSLSSMALSPFYLSLKRLPRADITHPSILILEKLNKLPRIDYCKVQKHKLIFLQDYYETFGKKTSLEEFIEENSWVKGYALFKTLKEETQGLPWTKWPKTWKNPSQNEVETLLATYAPRVNFHIFLQYLCFEQMSEVKQMAKSHGIFLKGDFPLLIRKDSVDTWQHQNLFDLKTEGGAPPDHFNPYGQNWKCPIYRWDKMKEENFAWWKRRLTTAEKLYDIYRIDHFPGLFNQWGIPAGSDPRHGYFIPKNDKEWLPHGKSIIEALIKECSMLPIAEDLGIIPDGVRELMVEFGICSTKVLRWENGNSFNPLSLSTLSTHDIDPLKLWWQTRPDEAKQYCIDRNVPWEEKLSFSLQLKLLEECHHTSSLFRVNLLQEYLTLFPELHRENLQEERINTAGTICTMNWSLRTRPTVEEFTHHEGLTRVMQSLSKKC